MTTLGRRQFLAGSAAAMAALNGAVFPARKALAASLNVPEVDRVTVRVLLDSSHDLFLGAQKANGVEIQRARPAAFPKIQSMGTGTLTRVATR